MPALYVSIPRPARACDRADHDLVVILGFQSAPARASMNPLNVMLLFQSARLARRDTNAQLVHTSVCFNPRAPRGGRQGTGQYWSAWKGVSIHAPRAGRDLPAS